MHKAQVTGQLVLSGSFECRDNEGNVLKIIDFCLPVTDEQAQQLTEGAEHGTDDCE